VAYGLRSQYLSIRKFISPMTYQPEQALSCFRLFFIAGSDLTESNPITGIFCMEHEVKNIAKRLAIKIANSWNE